MASCMHSKSSIDTLIIVCCHAIYLGQGNVQPSTPETMVQERVGTYPEAILHDNSVGSSTLDTAKREENWLIEPFQQGEVSTFLDHIRKGLELLSNNTDAILCFSGGVTKPDRTERSEAHGYYEAAQDLGWFGLQTEGILDLKGRVFEERWATDSFQNVLLSLVRWSEWVEAVENVRGIEDKTTMMIREQESVSSEKRKLSLPRKLIIVSHEFKRQRFLDLHLPAIMQIWAKVVSTPWSLKNVQFVGINPPFDEVRMREIAEGDRKRGYGMWKEDPLGTGKALRGKRETRGWDKQKVMASAWTGYDKECCREINLLLV